MHTHTHTRDRSTADLHWEWDIGRVIWLLDFSPSLDALVYSEAAIVSEQRRDMKVERLLACRVRTHWPSYVMVHLSYA